jgi:putative heme-binding domain-containing protein
VDDRPGPVNALLAGTAGRDDPCHSAVVSGLEAALAGRRKAKKPAAWDGFRSALASSNDRGLREHVRELDVVFGDGRALDEVRRLALDESADIDERKTALRTLIEGRPADLRAICERLVRVRFLNSVAVRGLVLFDDPEIGRSLARNYRSFHPSERSAAIEVLVSRPAFARALLDQVAAGRISRDDITAFHARQILSLGDPALARRLSEVWGELRGTAADRRDRIAALKKRLDPATLASADRSRGRALFDRLCANCHRLHGSGGQIGPDLTGSGRENIDYLLENIVDPGATVSADFRMVVVAMRDGRVLNGLIKAQSPRTLTLQTQTEAVALDRDDVEGVRPSASSLMPDGLLDPLAPGEIRDLIAYLSHPTQVPPPQAASAK